MQFENATMTNPTYFDKYENLAFTRDEGGVLLLRFHTDGGPIVFTGQTHQDLPAAFEDGRRRRHSAPIIRVAPLGLDADRSRAGSHVMRPQRSHERSAGTGARRDAEAASQAAYLARRKLAATQPRAA